MNKLDKQYKQLLQDIIDYGVEKKDRTGTGTKSIFGYTIRHKMSDGFPLLTTKKMAWKTMVTELLWFLRGDTNIKFLVDNDCHIWDGDAYKRYVNSPEVKIPYSKEDFINKIKTDKEWEDKFKQRDAQIAKDNLFKEVVSKAKSSVLGLKPILPKDAAKAEKQMELLVAELLKLEFNKTEDGKDFILAKEGKPVEDAHGNRINFDTYVKSTAESIWDFEQGQQRQSSGNNNDGNGQGGAQGKWIGKVPANEDEFIAAIGSAKDATERLAIADSYEASKKQ